MSDHTLRLYAATHNLPVLSFWVVKKMEVKGKLFGQELRNITSLAMSYALEGTLLNNLFYNLDNCQKY